ncbi:CREB/ATF bZIP transcription factor [Pseudoliparis swirei]|uniref:CREB/ATF bZIP transcription factor n=1 Tax=Pseudoliparis swirei TaxID=2059687 RepID=UPI0024BE53CC|nr:CREB/ATF bZIP transcription factor [Pseudoliparis swirei]
MITRRSRPVSDAARPLEVAVVERLEDFSSPAEGFPSDGTAGVALDDLFGIEDLNWTLGRDAASSLFDMELADLGFGTNDHDSEAEASRASSPDRTSSASRPKTRPSQSNRTINKNAVAARLNRLRKKEYVDGLEKKAGVLSTANEALRQENGQLTKRVEELEDETRGATRTTTTTPCPESA